MGLFLLIGILLGLTAIYSVINERFLHLQSAIGLMLLALLTSLALAVVSLTMHVDSISWLRELVEKLDISEVLLNGVLCFMLFAGSAGVQIKSLEDKKWVILSLAIGSTIIACGLTGFLLSTVLGWFGVTLALAFVGGSTQPTLSDAVLLFLREVLGGVGLGLIVGFITHYMLLRTSDFGNQLLITLATVTLGYGIALEIDVSGPIGMVVAGLLVGNLTAPRLAEKVRAPLRTFWTGIDDTLNSLLFVMMGFIVIFVHNLALAPLGLSIAVAILVCLVARAISVYTSLALLTSSNVLKADAFAMTKLFTWAGLRGGLALALALSLPESPEKALIVNMTFGVVAFSILVQGSTIGKLFSPAYLKSILKS